MKIILTSHAEEQILLRKLERVQVMEVASNPGQLLPAMKGRQIAQSKYRKDDKEYLLRVLVEDREDARWVITVYPTTKVRKYWQEK